MRYYFFILIFTFYFLSCSGPATYQDDGRPVEEQINDLIGSMTLTEKMDMIHGNAKFRTAGVPRLGIPRWVLSDGPHGVREEISEHSWNPAGWTTDSASYFPTGTALAATWNPELANKMGIALGQEARFRGKDVLLGPGINIHRTPLCGRNFEYMSEDPYLISRMVVPYIQGVQTQDVAACVKHYALNNQEVDRDWINVIVDERALREIYLPGFEAAVREGKAHTIMGAYNKYHNQYCCENFYMLKDILKGEWGFEGVVISDWNAVHSTVPSALAGLDLEMGTVVEQYEDYYFADSLQKAVSANLVPEQTVDDKVRRILRIMFRTGIFGDRSTGSFNTPEHQILARQIASEAIVLLKNDRQILPLDANNLSSIAVIGDNANRVHASGGYSSGIKALYEITPLAALKNHLNGSVQIKFAPGYIKAGEYTIGRPFEFQVDTLAARKAIDEAVSVAASSDAAIIFAGLNHDLDTEGKDREDMKLPYMQDELIKAVAKANPQTIVVLISGSPTEIAGWTNDVRAILQAWFAGMEGGTAMTRVLFGEDNPSGKLPFTFPVKLTDSPAHKRGEYPGDHTDVTYNEGLYVGYRYFDSFDVQPLFAFGHGLSYTSFGYSNLEMPESVLNTDSLSVKCTVKNTGKSFGAEVVQLYVADSESTLPRPAKELKGFRKVFLQAGQEEQVEFRLDTRSLAYYDPEQKHWVAEKGKFNILIGSSSRDIRLSGSFMLTESVKQ